MQILRFKELAQAYGGDITRWPEDERFSAEWLLDSDPRAAAVLREAGELDLLLDVFPAVRPGADLRDALTAAAPRARRAGLLGLDWRQLFVPGAGLAAAGIAGLLVGVALSLQAAETAQTDALVDSALVDNAADDGALPLTVSQTLPMGRA